MAYIDYERAWVAFKRVVLAKNSHGQRDLLAEMARIELECVEESQRAGIEALARLTEQSEEAATTRLREVGGHA